MWNINATGWRVLALSCLWLRSMWMFELNGGLGVTLATKYEMCLNEIGIAGASPELTLDMYCPQVGGGSASSYSSTTNNWSREQCILRVRLNNPCTAKCPHGKEIRAELEAAGGDWKLEPFPGVAVGQKTKRRPKKKADPNDMWPGKNKERNIKMAIELIEGMSVADLAEKYYVSKTNIRKIAYRYFEAANPRVFKACPEKFNKTEFARRNKIFIRPFLVYHEGFSPELKGE